MNDQDNDVDSVLHAILLGMLIPDNPVEAARTTLQILSKLVGNAINHPQEEKYQRVSCHNDKISKHICDTPGASEFMDAIFFNRVDNDFVLLDRTRLLQANEAIKMALGSLPAKPPSSGPAAAPKPVAASASSDEYEQRKKEAEARQAAFAKKQEEDRRQKEMLTQRMRQEQREVQSRPIVASKAVSIQRQDRGGGGGGQIVYTNTDREFQAMLQSKQFVLANFTATWCGPCKAVGPQVEELAKSNAHVQFVKIDIDENQDTPGKFQVSAVPTFILFKNGSKVGEVKGANASAIQQLVAQAM